MEIESYEDIFNSDDEGVVDIWEACEKCGLVGEHSLDCPYANLSLDESKQK